MSKLQKITILTSIVNSNIPTDNKTIMLLIF